eukprot:7684646-Pyramimonas_sp.AAC.1
MAPGKQGPTSARAGDSETSMAGAYRHAQLAYDILICHVVDGCHSRIQVTPLHRARIIHGCVLA